MSESPQVGETVNCQVEVLSTVEKLDKRQNSVVNRVGIRFTSGPFKGLETSVKKGNSSSSSSSSSGSRPKGVRKVAKQPQAQGGPSANEEGEDE